MRRRRRARTARTVGTRFWVRAMASTLALVMGLFTAAAAFAQEGFRLEEPGIQGYSVIATGSPSGIEFFEQAIPIPVDPGKPQFEITQSHTSATLNVGPTSRAVASSIWPGAAVGDGFPTVCSCDQPYPIRAEAQYPGEINRQALEAPNGGGMSTIAEGLDVYAQADASDSPGPEIMDFGTVSSVSKTTLIDGKAVANVDVTIGDVSLLAGLITIDSVGSVMEAVSDTVAATTTGSTTVTGLTIMGQGYEFGEEGLQPVEPEPDPDNPSEEPSDGGLLGDITDNLPDVVAVIRDVLGADALREQIGISAVVLEQVETIDGPNGRREAQGLRIIIETAPLRSALNALPLGDLANMIPDDDLRAQAFFILGLAPRIDFVLGKALVAAGATAPFEVAAPPPPPPPATVVTPTAQPTTQPAPAPVAPAPVAPIAGGGFTSPITTTTTSGGEQPVAVAPPAESAPVEQAPQVAQPVTLAAIELPDFFSGLSPILGLFALGLAMAGAYGLAGLSTAAMTATVTTSGTQCALTNTKLHDLRGTA